MNSYETVKSPKQLPIKETSWCILGATLLVSNIQTLWSVSASFKFFLHSIRITCLLLHSSFWFQTQSPVKMAGLLSWRHIICPGILDKHPGYQSGMFSDTWLRLLSFELGSNRKRPHSKWAFVGCAGTEPCKPQDPIVKIPAANVLMPSTPGQACVHRS